METTDSIFQRIESTICGGGFEMLGLMRISVEFKKTMFGSHWETM
ncbi:hypothetical protein MTBBW1_10010 [Desulfamplus magnetovallimortis]|uniref:Uncharacterized protein n=1 Tax=Desulfamplus magnetovallimortis TaxID=1246637 RepID=A0A1W1H4F4_9BACT|nr:hypothetical protein MTBBW1_10010 [Desulfamplus magnetovallimortis]